MYKILSRISTGTIIFKIGLKELTIKICFFCFETVFKLEINTFCAQSSCFNQRSTAVAYCSTKIQRIRCSFEYERYNSTFDIAFK